MSQKNERPTITDRAPEANSNATTGAAYFDYDKSIVDAVEKSLWEAIFDGDFRLGVRCRRCGRWLFNGRSKRLHYGPICALKAVTEAVA